MPWPLSWHVASICQPVPQSTSSRRCMQQVKICQEGHGRQAVSDWPAHTRFSLCPSYLLCPHFRAESCVGGSVQVLARLVVMRLRGSGGEWWGVVTTSGGSCGGCHCVFTAGATRCEGGPKASVTAHKSSWCWCTWWSAGDSVAVSLASQEGPSWHHTAVCTTNMVARVFWGWRWGFEES